MTQTENDDRYARCLKELRSLIPDDEYHEVMSQDMCELDSEFLGFVDVYKNLSRIIPKGSIVIDFGCYLAAQSYFFARHKMYIGVDVVSMRRFTPPNSVHYTMSIQNFAICSYVPDFQATEMVRKTFPNVFCYYPCGV